MEPSGLTERTLACRECGWEGSPDAFLDSLAKFWPDLGVTGQTCIRCGNREEVRVVTGGIQFGYTYAAGSVHFAPMEWCPVPDLKVETQGDSLKVRLRDRTWTIGR